MSDGNWPGSTGPRRLGRQGPNLEPPFLSQGPLLRGSPSDSPEGSVFPTGGLFRLRDPDPNSSPEISRSKQIGNHDSFVTGCPRAALPCCTSELLSPASNLPHNHEASTVHEEKTSINPACFPERAGNSQHPAGLELSQASGQGRYSLVGTTQGLRVGRGTGCRVQEGSRRGGECPLPTGTEAK